jgi:multidrug efflux system membrane fusion protein
MRFAVTTQPSEQLTLAVKGSGYVESILQVRGDGGRPRIVQPGDAVQAGTVLLRIRDAEYKELLEQAEAALAEASANDAKTKLDLQRARALFAADALTKPELDSAQAAAEMATAREASARSRVASARLALADSVLSSPLTGVVLERRVENGMLASAGMVAFVLARVSDIKALAGVPDHVVQRLAVGHPLVITTEAFPGEAFAGRVTAIAPSADPQSRVFGVEVTIPNRDGRLRPGMVGALELPAGEAAEDEVAVPLTAVVRASGDAAGFAVFVVAPGDGGDTAHLRPVQLGSPSGNVVAVTTGLAAGERVIVMGATLVTDGDRVRVIP